MNRHFAEPNTVKRMILEKAPPLIPVGTPDVAVHEHPEGGG